MDEVGCGTSTHDGLSLARAAAVHCTQQSRVHAVRHPLLSHRAGHEYPTIANVHLDAVEYGEQLVFMHAVKDGPVNRSRPQVASWMACRNRHRRCTTHPAELECGMHQHASAGKATTEPSPQLGLFAPQPLQWSAPGNHRS